MQAEELEFICQEAARDLLAREGRPLPPTLVLPGPSATRLIRIPDLPDDPMDRAAVIDALAREEVLARSLPAYGFVAEGEVADGTDVVVVVFGAHSLPPRITAATFQTDESLAEFARAEPLDPAAMPFLHALQHAVEEVRAGIPGFGADPP